MIGSQLGLQSSMYGNDPRAATRVENAGRSSSTQEQGSRQRLTPFEQLVKNTRPQPKRVNTQQSVAPIAKQEKPVASPSAVVRATIVSSSNVERVVEIPMSTEFALSTSKEAKLLPPSSLSQVGAKNESDQNEPKTEHSQQSLVLSEVHVEPNGSVSSAMTAYAVSAYRVFQKEDWMRSKPSSSVDSSNPLLRRIDHVA